MAHPARHGVELRIQWLLRLPCQPGYHRHRHCDERHSDQLMTCRVPPADILAVLENRYEKND